MNAEATLQKNLLGDLCPNIPIEKMSFVTPSTKSANNDSTESTTVTSVATANINTIVNDSSAVVAPTITVMNTSISPMNAQISKPADILSFDNFDSLLTTKSKENESATIKRAVPTTMSGAIYNVIDTAFGYAISHIRVFLNTPVEKTLCSRIIAKLNAADAYLDKKFPNMWIQRKIDGLGLYQTETAQVKTDEMIATNEFAEKVEKKFSRLQRFDAWVRENADSKENWYMQLATYLVKLPLRSAMNVLNLLYSVIETILYTAVHPIKSINRIMKMIVSLVNELGKPETWTKIGVGTIAMQLGQIAIFTNPISHMALAIGATLTIAGLSFGALKAAILNEGNELNAAKDNLFNQFKEIPECFLTALFMGMITGGIQKAMTPRFATYEEAKRYADNYVRKHNLPNYREIRLKANGNLVIDWGSNSWFRQNHPELFKYTKDRGYYSSNKFKIVIPQIGPKYAAAGGYSDYWRHTKWYTYHCSSFTIFKRYVTSIVTGKCYYGQNQTTYLWKVKGF